MQIKINPITRTAADGVTSINGYQVEIVDAPVLTGSEKQVAWADSIRTASVEDFIRNIVLGKVRAGDTILANCCFVTPEWEVAMASLSDGLDKLSQVLGQVETAKAWIDAAGGSKSSATVFALTRGK
ncbi:hypothetical protein [Sphingobium sp. Z007]|uniref:hypothetical protein n=1 Tax=Sphingobium sp. Z007 TaxID=627495 RepID=UPI001124EB63|nr:hypothetical protein [Sphingobium sp. Z007]